MSLRKIYVLLGMDGITFSIKSNIDQFSRELENEVARQQLPFATSLAINKLARLVAAGETQGIEETFPTATPFTKKAEGVIPSNKNKLEAVVFMKDIQAHYLEPYEFGGKQVPAKPSEVALLTPKNIKLNQYGNIPFGKVKSLKGRGDVFSGTITLKGGMKIGGVFQRLKGDKKGQRLKILVRFSDPQQVHQHLDYFKRAVKICERNFEAAMNDAMNYAMATAR